jgi:uncharacterized transporter YbjL
VVQAATCDALVGEAATTASATWVFPASGVGTATSSDKRGDGRGRAVMGWLSGAMTSSSMFCATWRMLARTSSAERRLFVSNALMTQCLA